jgi:hypothetical protein
MSALLASAFVAAFALFLYAALVIGRRLIRDDGRMRLAERLRGRGLALPQTNDETVLRASASAVRRCVACPAHERCDAALAAQDWKALRAICPNTTFIEALAPTPR